MIRSRASCFACPLTYGVIIDTDLVKLVVKSLPYCSTVISLRSLAC